MNRTYIAIFLIVAIIFLPMIFQIWNEEADPPFIANATYDCLIYKIIPVLAAISSVALFVICYRRYKRCSNFQESIKDPIDESGKFGSIIMTIFMPVFIYGCFWAGIAAPIKLWTYYSVNEPWSQVYQLSKVEGCGSDYEYHCVRLILVDLEADKEHSVRWYYDKASLMKLTGSHIKVIGDRGTFGLIVKDLKW